MTEPRRTGSVAPCEGSQRRRFGEGLSRHETLRRSADFVRCYRRGRRRQGSMAMLYVVPNKLNHPRLGTTASRKVGSAVQRNRLKRRTREIYRRWPDRHRLTAVDIVVHFRPGAGRTEFDDLRSELERMLNPLTC